MGIEGRLWSFTPETEYETCPECGGTGKDNATLDCKCYVMDQEELKRKIVKMMTKQNRNFKQKGDYYEKKIHLFYRR